MSTDFSGIMPVLVVETYQEMRSWLEEPILGAMDLPELQCDGVMCRQFLVRRSITENEIRNSLRISRLKGFLYPSDSVIGIKEKEIKLSIINLCGQIYNAYKEMSDNLSLDLTMSNFGQLVQRQISFRDLTPGDTTIAFEVFTTRSLVTRKVWDKLVSIEGLDRGRIKELA